MKIRNQESNRYYKGEEINWSVDVDYFKIYGVGLYLFFSFLKKICFLFLVMSFIELIPMIYNYVEGTAFVNASDSLQYLVARLTVGNQTSEKLNYSTSTQKN